MGPYLFLHIIFFQENILKSSNSCSLGSYLSMVDPWYNSNIRSLGYMIPEMVGKHPQVQKHTKNKKNRVFDFMSVMSDSNRPILGGQKTTLCLTSFPTTFVWGSSPSTSPSTLSRYRLMCMLAKLSSWAALIYSTFLKKPLISF